MNLIDFATEKQAKYLHAFEDLGSYSKTAKKFGVNESSVRRSLKALHYLAASKGFTPEADLNGVAGIGYSVTGKSTYYDADGKPKNQWVKTRKDKSEQLDQLYEAMQAVAEDYSGVIPKIKKKKIDRDEDLLAFIPIGDPHLGLYNWHKSGGEDYNLDRSIAELSVACRELIDKSPNAADCVIASLGDFFHYNTDSLRTNSGHTLAGSDCLDVVMLAGIALIKEMISYALKKFDKVTFFAVLGNHDDNASRALALVLKEAYLNNPRVDIRPAHSAYSYYKHGKCLFGLTHGQHCKADKLPGIMATDQAKGWGDTEYRKWFVGHYHSQKIQEFAGCSVEYFRTLAGADNWTHSSGYRSHKELNLIVFHKEYGQTDSVTVDIRLARALIDQQN